MFMKKCPSTIFMYPKYYVHCITRYYDGRFLVFSWECKNGGCHKFLGGFKIHDRNNDLLLQNYKDSNNFWQRKLTLKVRILPFLTTFTQLTARLKNILRGWLLTFGLKKCLVECATVSVKSEVILLCLEST